MEFLTHLYQMRKEPFSSYVEYPMLTRVVLLESSVYSSTEMR